MPQKAATGGADSMRKALSNSHTLAREHVDYTPLEQRKQLGQFFTSPDVAGFMADLIPPPANGLVRILDPGAGTGILGIAAARRVLGNSPARLSLVAFENDQSVLSRLHSSLHAAANDADGRLGVQVVERDFLEETERSLFSDPAGLFDVVIANPPYFKTSPSIPGGGGEPNAYARFMRRSGELLAEGGHLVFIVPRSFASGFYFRRFRAFLRERLSLQYVHVFDSRNEAFKDQSVLQENIIVVYRKGRDTSTEVEVSSSFGGADIQRARIVKVPRALVYASSRLDAPIRIPTTQEDISLLQRFDGFPARLKTLNLEISTGPVVPFRATEYIVRDEGPETGPTVPLLWLQHVTADGVSWPLARLKKPQRIRADAPTKLRAPNQTCVLLRRFSAKEDDRRLVAGVLREGEFSGPWIGLENHLNFVYRPGGKMRADEAEGLARILNSKAYDDYFRICNGNTQVGAIEMRDLPLPEAPEIARLGRLETSGVRREALSSDFTTP